MKGKEKDTKIIASRRRAQQGYGQPYGQGPAAPNYRPAHYGAVQPRQPRQPVYQTAGYQPQYQQQPQQGYYQQPAGYQPQYQQQMPAQQIPFYQGGQQGGYPYQVAPQYPTY